MRQRLPKIIVRGMGANAAGLLYGPLEHHLDHIAPFCSLAKIPLVITEEAIAKLARLYYPDLEVLEWGPLEAPFRVVQNFEILFYTIPKPLYDDLFFIAEKTLNKKLETVWIPHGNSDKGNHGPFFEALQDEKSLVVYGPQMRDLLRFKEIFRTCTEVGNFRLKYYLRHRPYYLSVVDPWVLPDEKIILYAPSWGDASTSFFEETEQLIAEIPRGYSLWIKPHPNLELNIQTEYFALKYQDHPQVRFIRRFPLVYPLLDKAAIYLGDTSSIGYDFLAFNRPMFFFNPEGRSLFLHRCGHTLNPHAKFFETVLRDPVQSHLSQIRDETYTYTFGV